jgi:hypothetical protein
MENVIKIFCEGIIDQIFIADCIEYFYNIKTTREKSKKELLIYSANLEIIDLKGCNNLANQFLSLDPMADNSLENGTNLVIFDADKEGHGNNGFSNAVKKMRDIQKQVKFNFYLWPNNELDGEIEHLLRQLIPSDKECLFECFKQYNNCLKESSLPNLQYSSDLKNQLNFYLYTLKESSEKHERDYKKKELWNLNFNEIADLYKFKNFLDEYFL